MQPRDEWAGVGVKEADGNQAGGSRGALTNWLRAWGKNQDPMSFYIVFFESVSLKYINNMEGLVKRR